MDAEKTMEAVKQENLPEENTEHLSEGRLYTPRTDIYETKDEVVVIADLPGVDETSLDITLEKNILTIRGGVDTRSPQGYSLVYGEYGVGDYLRRFSVSNEIDRDGIEAEIKDGVLHVRLPKAGPAKTRKIEIKGG